MLFHGTFQAAAPRHNNEGGVPVESGDTYWADRAGVRAGARIFFHPYECLFVQEEEVQTTHKYNDKKKQKAESRKQKAESRKQKMQKVEKAESRKQKAESRKQKTESRKQKPEEEEDQSAYPSIHPSFSHEQ